MNKWNSKSVKSLGKYKIFEIFKEIVENPRNKMEMDFYYLKLSNWTVVVPVTIDNKFVMVKQFRVGAKKFFYEFPGGLIDKGEEPVDAAKRELTEETGFFSENLKFLGEVYPLPAFQTSKCYIYLAENVKYIGGVSLDAGEDIETVILEKEEIENLLLNNQLDNAIMMLAYLKYKYFLCRNI